MKKLLLCMLFVVGCMAAQAQDVLVLRAGYEVEVQVQSTTETDIVYVPWDEPDGMSYSIPKTDVLSIRYADGRTEVLSTLGEGGRDAANQKSLEEQKKEAEEAQRLLEEQKAKEAAEKARLEQEAKERAAKAEQDRILRELQEKERLAREKAAAEEKARLEKERAEAAEKARQEAQKKRDAYTTALKENTDFNTVGFQSYVYVGVNMMPYSEGGTHVSYDLDASVGVRMKKYVYVGVETGYHFMPNAVQYDVRQENLSTHFWYVPIGVNVKGYIPAGMKAVEKRIYPYVNATIGGYLGTGVLGGKADLGSLNMVSLEETTPEWKNMSAGFYCQVGAGLDMNWGSIGVGYTCLLGNMNANQAYIKLGVRLGKTNGKQQTTEE